MDDLEKVQAQIAELAKKAEELIAQKKPAVIADIKTKMAAYGITTKDLGLSVGTLVVHKSSQAGVPVPIKYRQGEHTWSGRGRQPKWVEDYIKSGGKLEELAV